MLSWFNATEFQRFGEELAVLFMEEKPVSDGNRKQRRAQKGKANSNDPVQVTMRKLAARVTAFEARKQANFYKKAKFANAFKWKLREAGYDAEFADELTKELLIHFR